MIGLVNSLTYVKIILSCTTNKYLWYNIGYGCMKQLETYSGRGFESRHLHQKQLCSKCNNTLNKIVDAHDSAQIAFDGDALVSTG
jgi:hypothetical protein